MGFIEVHRDKAISFKVTNGRARIKVGPVRPTVHTQCENHISITKNTIFTIVRFFRDGVFPGITLHYFNLSTVSFYRIKSNSHILKVQQNWTEKHEAADVNSYLMGAPTCNLAVLVLDSKQTFAAARCILKNMLGDW